jgi:large subunit ribosomal protein L9
MEVILLEKVDNLGSLGDRVTVKRGYGRNFLIPKGKATEASEANVAAFEARRAELEKTQSDLRAAAEARLAELEGLALTIAAKVGTEGRLFGSVGPADIVIAAAESGIEIQRSEVRMAEPIRQIGETEVGVHLHADVNGVIKVEVVAAE